MDDELETKRSQHLVREECGCESDDRAPGWEGHLAQEDDGTESVVCFVRSASTSSDGEARGCGRGTSPARKSGRDSVAIFCPTCAIDRLSRECWPRRADRVPARLAVGWTCGFDGSKAKVCER